MFGVFKSKFLAFFMVCTAALSLSACLPDGNEVQTYESQKKLQESKNSMMINSMQTYALQSRQALVDLMLSGETIRGGAIDFNASTSPFSGMVSNGNSEEYVQSGICVDGDVVQHYTWFENTAVAGLRGNSAMMLQKLKQNVGAHNVAIYEGDRRFKRLSNQNAQTTESVSCSLDIPEGTPLLVYAVELPSDIERLANSVARYDYRTVACEDGMVGSVTQRRQITLATLNASPPGKPGDGAAGGSGASDGGTQWTQVSNNCRSPITVANVDVNTETPTLIEMDMNGGAISENIRNALRNIKCLRTAAAQEDTAGMSDEELAKYVADSCSEAGDILDQEELEYTVLDPSYDRFERYLQECGGQAGEISPESIFSKYTGERLYEPWNGEVIYERRLRAHVTSDDLDGENDEITYARGHWYGHTIDCKRLEDLNISCDQLTGPTSVTEPNYYETKTVALGGRYIWTLFGRWFSTCYFGCNKNWRHEYTYINPDYFNDLTVLHEQEGFDNPGLRLTRFNEINEWSDTGEESMNPTPAQPIDPRWTLPQANRRCIWADFDPTVVCDPNVSPQTDVSWQDYLQDRLTDRAIEGVLSQYGVTEYDENSGFTEERHDIATDITQNYYGQSTKFHDTPMTYIRKDVPEYPYHNYQGEIIGIEKGPAQLILDPEVLARINTHPRILDNVILTTTIPNIDDQLIDSETGRYMDFGGYSLKDGVTLTDLSRSEIREIAPPDLELNSITIDDLDVAGICHFREDLCDFEGVNPKYLTRIALKYTRCTWGLSGPKCRTMTEWEHNVYRVQVEEVNDVPAPVVASKYRKARQMQATFPGPIDAYIPMLDFVPTASVLPDENITYTAGAASSCQYQKSVCTDFYMYNGDNEHFNCSMQTKWTDLPPAPAGHRWAYQNTYAAYSHTESYSRGEGDDVQAVGKQCRLYFLQTTVGAPQFKDGRAYYVTLLEEAGRVRVHHTPNIDYGSQDFVFETTRFPEGERMFCRQFRVTTDDFYTAYETRGYSGFESQFGSKAKYTPWRAYGRGNAFFGEAKKTDVVLPFEEIDTTIGGDDSVPVALQGCTAEEWLCESYYYSMNRLPSLAEAMYWRELMERMMINQDMSQDQAVAEIGIDIENLPESIAFATGDDVNQDAQAQVQNELQAFLTSYDADLDLSLTCNGSRDCSQNLSQSFVEGLYSSYLEETPSAPELSEWVSELQTGSMRPVDVEAAIEAIAEQRAAEEEAARLAAEQAAAEEAARLAAEQEEAEEQNDQEVGAQEAE